MCAENKVEMMTEKGDLDSAQIMPKVRRGCCCCSFHAIFCCDSFYCVRFACVLFVCVLDVDDLSGKRIGLVFSKGKHFFLVLLFVFHVSIDVLRGCSRVVYFAFDRSVRCHCVIIIVQMEKVF